MENAVQYAVATDVEIITKVLGGEMALFEVLIRRYNPLLYKIARGYGFNHQDAEDLMQETYVATYQNLRQFAGKASFKTWISKIMIHRCIYKLNHGSARKEQPASDFIHENATPMHSVAIQSPEQASVSREFSSILEHALQKMPLNYRSVFLLRQIE